MNSAVIRKWGSTVGKWSKGLFRPSRRLRVLALVLLFFPVLGAVDELMGKGYHFPDLGARLENASAPDFSAGGADICLGGPEFYAALRRDLAGARQRVLVQTLSFEGDQAGTALTEALIASPAAEKCLLIDSYSLFIQSDRFVGSPVRLFNFALFREACRMRRLVKRLRAGGVEVVFGRPYGLGRDNLQARDHKKLCVVDDVAYLGGINFSDHNFQWRDLMLRVENSRAADALAADFARSLGGKSADGRVDCGGLELVFGSGAGCRTIADRMAEAIDLAQESIYLECPYITEPLFGLLAQARGRGVEVTIVTSEHINRFGMKWSIQNACARHDLELRLWPETMTHIKALLVDDRQLVLGSSNFDFLSGYLQPELLAVVSDSTVLGQFHQRIFEPSMVGTWSWSEIGERPCFGPVGRTVMNLAESFLSALHTRE